MQSLSGRHAQEEGRAHGQGYRNVKLSPYIKRRVSYESSLDMALSFDTDVFPPVIGKQEIDSPALWANPDAFHAKDGIVVSACRMACFVSRDQMDGILNQPYNRGVL